MGYIVTMTNGELYHHGVLGQKWGVRRYQNLDGSLKKRAKSDSSTSAGKNSPINLSEKQKKIIKGFLITVGAATVVGGSVYLAKSGKLDKINIQAGKDFLKDNPIMKQKVAGSSGNNIEYDNIQNAIKDANKVFGRKEGINGCVPAAIAGCLRKNGIPAESIGSPGQKQLLFGGVIEDCFKNVKVKEGSAVKFGKSRKDAEEFILNNFGKGDGFGAVSIQWKEHNELNAKGGHAFLWEVKKGIVSFCDTDHDNNTINVFWNAIDSRNSMTSCKLSDIIESNINFDKLAKYGVIIKRK